MTQPATRIETTPSEDPRDHLRVDEVQGKADLDVLLRFPFRIYRDDPCWVPPLGYSLRRKLAPKHPFFRDAEIRMFLARRGDEVLGTIPERILEKQSAYVDTITGATLSSNTIMDAVEDALSKATSKP